MRSWARANPTTRRRSRSGPGSPPARRTRPSALASELVAIGLLLAGCSLTSASSDPCESSLECRDAFGLGSTCGDDGFCRATELPPRCARTFPANLLTDPALGEAYVVGTIVDESVETHLARQNAVQLAIIEARDDGGLDGRPVGVVFCTNEANASLDALVQLEATESVTRYLAEDLAVDAIVGPPSSDAVEVAFEVSRPADVLMISPSATSPALTELEPDASDDSPGLLWRTVAPDSLQGRVIADDLEMRGVTNVALILEDGSYGTGLAAVFEDNFEGTVERFPFTTTSARNAAATSAGAGGFEEVLFISSQTADASAFLLFAASFEGYEDKQIFLTDSAKNLDLLTDAAGASALFGQIRGTAPSLPTGVTYMAFLASYSAEFGEDASAFSFAAHSFDAAWLAVLGGYWATLQGVPTRGSALARGLRRISSGDPVELGPTALTDARGAFEASMPIDVRGASGELDYDPQSEETRSPIEVWTIDGGGDAFVSEYEVTP